MAVAGDSGRLTRNCEWNPFNPQTANQTKAYIPIQYIYIYIYLEAPKPPTDPHRLTLSLDHLSLLLKSAAPASNDHNLARHGGIMRVASWRQIPGLGLEMFDMFVGSWARRLGVRYGKIIINWESQKTHPDIVPSYGRTPPFNAPLKTAGRSPGMVLGAPCSFAAEAAAKTAVMLHSGACERYMTTLSRQRAHSLRLHAV